MNVHVWYDVVSMFVNDVVCDRDIVYSGKEILVLRLLGCVLFGISIYLQRYSNSTGTLDSYRWRLPVSEDSKEVYIWSCPRFEIWADQDRIYGLTLCIWELYLRFEIGTDQDRLYPLSLTQCMSLLDVESLVSLYVSQYMYDMRWIMKIWFVVVWLRYKFNLWKYIF